MKSISRVLILTLHKGPIIPMHSSKHKVSDSQATIVHASLRLICLFEHNQYCHHHNDRHWQHEGLEKPCFYEVYKRIRYFQYFPSNISRTTMSHEGSKSTPESHHLHHRSRLSLTDPVPCHREAAIASDIQRNRSIFLREHCICSFEGARIMPARDCPRFLWGDWANRPDSLVTSSE